jgi:hypothetical protein
MRWTIEFDPTGLDPGEARMASAVIDGNLRMLRLAFPATSGGSSEDEDRKRAESVCRIVADEFPHIAFQVVPISEEDTVGKASDG